MPFSGRSENVDKYVELQVFRTSDMNGEEVGDIELEGLNEERKGGHIEGISMGKDN